ncbi:phage tail sheath family protein [Photorhabdus viridis]|uniref:phage tail sheath family protein n=1 Tax=Photorhabdus viridis TaxID=3163327 RepID=UPI003306F1B2
MMEMNFPGVQFSDIPLSRVQADIPTAAPVFIGYCEKGKANTLYTITDWIDYQHQLGLYDQSQRSILAYAMRHYFDNGGGACFVLSLGPYSVVSKQAFSSALVDEKVKQLISAEPAITLVAAPDLRLLGDEDGAEKDWLSCWQALLTICQQRSGLFAILDTPETAATVVRIAQDIEKSSQGMFMSGAGYWPYLETSYMQNNGDLNSPYVVVPPSAAIAAVYQHVDREQGIWTAPANIALAEVVRPTQSYQAGLSLFNNSGVSLNVIRSFPGRGVRVWGARTLCSANRGVNTPWVYIQRRRLVSYIEANLSEIARFVVFEPNNEITWLKLKGQASTWLRELWRQGALFGQQESEAFQLFLGQGETMTQDDIHAGRLIMRVSLALLSPAEFIDLNLQFTTSESNTRQQAWVLNRGEF